MICKLVFMLLVSSGYGMTTQNCEMNEVYCRADDKCIYSTWRCDGYDDCSDGEDEKDCSDYTCPDEYFRCDDNTCVWGQSCDGFKSCRDGSDERNCEEYECPVGKFRCNDHTCVWAEICNGYSSCTDGSDELNCQDHVCPADKFRCDDHTCVWDGFRCDGYANCKDGSDESHCEAHVCAEEKVKCDDFTCVWGALCNGLKECKDESDEQNCKVGPILDARQGTGKIDMSRNVLQAENQMEAYKRLFLERHYSGLNEQNMQKQLSEDRISIMLLKELDALKLRERDMINQITNQNSNKLPEAKNLRNNQRDIMSKERIDSATGLEVENVIRSKDSKRNNAEGNERKMELMELEHKLLNAFAEKRH